MVDQRSKDDIDVVVVLDDEKPEISVSPDPEDSPSRFQSAWKWMAYAFAALLLVGIVYAAGSSDLNGDAKPENTDVQLP